MPVRKTERRIPEGLLPDDLGQSVSAENGQAALISYIISPLVVNRPNTYVAFITDPNLADSIQNFEWTVTENDIAAAPHLTATGEFIYVPHSTGNLNIALRFLDGGNQEVAGLAMAQEIVDTNGELEELIHTSADQPGPGIGNLDVARELVNDHNPYYQSVSLQTAEAGDGFKQFVFSMVSDGVLQKNAAQRKELLDQLAVSLNNGTSDFSTLIAEGAGVCKIRMTMLAMISSNGLAWTELPEDPTLRLSADEQLRQTLAELDENKKIDLYNLVRFPKSNIVQCGRILEELRNHYFPNANFSDVLTGMSGTRAHWISRHYREGPILAD
jgi:hypothetical protein